MKVVVFMVVELKGSRTDDNDAPAHEGGVIGASGGEGRKENGE